jgi:mediator of RNA polymerase II transcription subunit 31
MPAALSSSGAVTGCLPILWTVQTAAAPSATAAGAAAGLAQNKFLEDKAFLNYLKYLEYWRQPQYATYIRCGVQGA